MKTLSLVTKIPVWIGGLLIISVVLITVADVFARKFLNTGYFGLVDITQLAVVGFAYLAMPRAFLLGSHVSVELYDQYLSERMNSLLKLLSLTLCIGVLSVLLWYGWIQAERSYRYGDVSQNVEIPIIGYWGLLLGGIAISWLVCVIQFFQHLGALFKTPSTKQSHV